MLSRYCDWVILSSRQRLIGSFIDERFKYSKDKKASSFVSFDAKVTQMKMIENKNIFINVKYLDKGYKV